MQNFFKRFEKKYIINRTQYELLMHFAADKLKEEIRNEYTVRNLYYDTENYELIRASIEKPIYREKLRLRTYDVPGIGTPAFIELKKKIDGIVFKRRFKAELLEAIAFLGGGNVPYTKSEDTHIIDEIKYFLMCNDVKPKAFVSYNRQCFFGAEYPEFRITFDSRIIYQNIGAESKDVDNTFDGGIPKAILEPDKMIMEIKTPASVPVWLSKVMSELNIYPSSFSKYGVAYKTYVAKDLFTEKPADQKKRTEVVMSA